MASRSGYRGFIGPRLKDGRVLRYKDRKDPEKILLKARRYAPRRRELLLKTKLHVLAYYGKEKRLQCCWDTCGICDPDMLTIDHVNNDGAVDRKTRGGKEIYRRLVARGYPLGYQTLCHNHQWKKEMMRRRGEN
jgi:hypothetical protein